MAEQLALRKPVYLWINNGDLKIFTVPTWQTQDTDLIGTVLLDLRCHAKRWTTMRCSFSESHTKRYKSSIFELNAIWWRPQLRSPTVSFLSNPGSICTWHRQRWALRNFTLWYPARTVRNKNGRTKIAHFGMFCHLRTECGLPCSVAIPCLWGRHTCARSGAMSCSQARSIDLQPHQSQAIGEVRMFAQSWPCSWTGATPRQPH